MVSLSRDSSYRTTSGLIEPPQVQRGTPLLLSMCWAVKERPQDMWRYRELLPVEADTPAPPLRVGWSPLYEAERLAKQLGLKKLWVKDDGVNPTASLKDRASSMAVAKALSEV